MNTSVDGLKENISGSLRRGESSRSRKFPLERKALEVLTLTPDTSRSSLKTPWISVTHWDWLVNTETNHSNLDGCKEVRIEINHIVITRWLKYGSHWGILLGQWCFVQIYKRNHCHCSLSNGTIGKWLNKTQYLYARTVLTLILMPWVLTDCSQIALWLLSEYFLSAL